MRILPPRTFPPLDKIERRHTPAPAASQRGYQGYRTCLRWEFGFTCAFCLLHEADLIDHGIERTGLTTVEHFALQSQAPEKTNEYSNCFYACRFCNGARGKAPVVGSRGQSLLNPCEHAWGVHFQLGEDDRLSPRAGDADAVYTEFVYDLNDRRKIEIRSWRRERLEELLKVLREAPAAAQELVGLCGSVEPSAQDLLLRTAQRLWNDVRRAQRDLRRFAAIPRDAKSCRCGHLDHHELPPYLAGQTLEVDDLVPAAGEERLHEVDRTVLLYVPGGEYLLGADDIGEKHKPVHRVVLSPFWMAKYPVTNEQYSRFLGANPGTRKPKHWTNEQFNKPEQPVVGVSWMEAQAYCRWAGLRLPSEAQWEAAARGTDGRRFPWGNEKPTPKHANFGNREGRTTLAGFYPKGRGPFGALDQAGNVWEWCEDVWNTAAYRERDGQRDPLATSGNTAFRCLRGGSWPCDVRFLDVAYRSGNWARLQLKDVGFRCLSPAAPRV